MVDKIEMSLEEIIQSSRKSRGGGGAGKKFDRSRRPGGRGGGSFKSRQGGGGVQKGRTRGGGGVTKPYVRGDVNGAWKHDMFNDFGAARKRTNSAGIFTNSGSAKLLVSNLDFGVSESDIQELFSEFGNLKNASVHYDKSGRSLGTADVVFERRADALKAMKQYNGVPLDGRAMNIQLATSDINTLRPSGGASGRLGNTQGGRRQGGPRVTSRSPGFKRRGPPGAGGRRNSGGAGGQRGPRGKKPTPTIEQLDAELDAYVKQIK